MGEQESKSSSGLLEKLIVVILIMVVAALFVESAIPPFLDRNRISPANVCINNLRQIDVAKNQWGIEHNAKTNDVVTVSAIKPYLERLVDPRGKPYIKLDAKGDLPKCPSGGTYTIGEIGEPPTCSLGTSVDPPHVSP
jgi:hypothetical protein